MLMEAFDRIRERLQHQPIVLFLKGTPDKPMCQGSADAVSALQSVNAEYLSVNLQTDPIIRAYLPKFSEFPTFPQLFMMGEFVGGADVVKDLESSGDLENMVNACRTPSVING